MIVTIIFIIIKILIITAISVLIVINVWALKPKYMYELYPSNSGYVMAMTLQTVG